MTIRALFPDSPLDRSPQKTSFPQKKHTKNEVLGSVGGLSVCHHTQMWAPSSTLRPPQVASPNALSSASFSIPLFGGSSVSRMGTLPRNPRLGRCSPAPPLIFPEWKGGEKPRLLDAWVGVFGRVWWLVVKGFPRGRQPSAPALSSPSARLPLSGVLGFRGPHSALFPQKHRLGRWLSPPPFVFESGGTRRASAARCEVSRGEIVGWGAGRRRCQTPRP